MELFVQSHQVTLQHGHGDLSDHGDVDHTWNFEQGFLVDIFERCDVYDGRVGLDPFSGESVVLCGDSSDDNRRLWTPPGFESIGK